MSENEKVTVVQTEDEQQTPVSRKPRKLLLSSFMVAIMAMALAFSSFAADGEGEVTAGNLSSGVSTIVGVVGQVVSLITGNTILMAMLGAGLLSVAIGVFARLFHSLRG